MANKRKALKRVKKGIAGLTLDIVELYHRDTEDLIARCLDSTCCWVGRLKDCGTDWESEGWEYPEYQVAICPKCGTVVEI